MPARAVFIFLYFELCVLRTSQVFNRFLCVVICSARYLNAVTCWCKITDNQWIFVHVQLKVCVCLCYKNDNFETIDYHCCGWMFRLYKCLHYTRSLKDVFIFTVFKCNYRDSSTYLYTDTIIYSITISFLLFDALKMIHRTRKLCLT